MDINSFVIGYTKGKASGGGSMEGFHMVRFFNDDNTLLYTVFVPHGASVIYAGETPVSTEGLDVFRGFEPSPANVTEDMDCYAVYEAVGTLDETSWAMISQLSASGEAQNYFALGDTKMIHIEGMVGTLEVNGDYGVYIIGFDHDEEVEGKGITFGTFRKPNGLDIALCDSGHDSAYTQGLKYFNLNHWGKQSHGGWAGSDLRYDVLGSTDIEPSGYGAAKTESVVGYDATETCATNPVPDTLMAALPSDLRAVMKPMTKYTDTKGYQGNAETVKASIDYLPLLAECEIFGKRLWGSTDEVSMQKQYQYFKDGAPTVKSMHSNSGFYGVRWWERSGYTMSTGVGCAVKADGTGNYSYVHYSLGIAPIFKV